MIRAAWGALRAALARRLLGVTAEEIRYTFDDVRQEVRAARAELLAEIAVLRRDLDALAGREIRPDDDDAQKPIAEA